MLADQAKKLGTSVPSVQAPPSGWADNMLNDMLLSQQLQDDPETTMYNLQKQLYDAKALMNYNASLSALGDWTKLAQG